MFRHVWIFFGHVWIFLVFLRSFFFFQWPVLRAFWELFLLYFFEGPGQGTPMYMVRISEEQWIPGGAKLKFCFLKPKGLRNCRYFPNYQPSEIVLFDVRPRSRCLLLRAR